MPQLVMINGVYWPMAVDTVEEEPEEIGAVRARSLNGIGVTTRVARKRMWRGRSSFHVAAEGEAWRRFVEGDAQSWRFDKAAISTKGLGPSSGTFATALTDGVHGYGKVTPASSSWIGYTLARRLGVPGGWTAQKGWTLLLWKRLSPADGGDGTTYHHHVVAGAVNVNRGAAANPPGVQQWRNGVVGNYGVGNWLSVGATTALWGFSDAGVGGAAFAYSGVVVLPFVVPASWVPGLFAFHTASSWPAIQRVRLGGDVVADAGGDVDAIGLVRRLPQRSIILDGQHRNNARVLEIELSEA